MKFHSVANKDWYGTSLLGYIQATREQMINAFGEPSRTYNDQIDRCWQLQFESGPMVRIYDWKLREPLMFAELYAWHIGGRSISAVTLVHDAFREAHRLHTRSTWPDTGSVRAA